MEDMGEPGTPGATTPRAPIRLGCLGWAAIAVIAIIIMIIAGCASRSSEPKANPYAYTPTAVPTPATVDSTVTARAHELCETHLKTVALNSGRAIAGVQPKPYEITSITFTGPVEHLDMPYKKTAYDVPVTWVSKRPDGTTGSVQEICRTRPEDDFVQTRRP